MKHLDFKWRLLGKLTVICILVLACMFIPVTVSKYVSQAESSAGARVARFSYAISGDNSTKSITNTATLGNQGAVIAVEEIFTITNDGEVAYHYMLNLSIADQDSNSIEGYSLSAPTQNVFMLSSSSIINLPNYAENAFYFKKNNSTSFSASNAPQITGTLNVGESDTYTVLYFINLTPNSETGLPSGVSLGKQVTLNYAVTCTQID